nr:2Fe-2S iron-sulfur cluster binding domain-containing protein [Saccharothrix sp.]
MKVLTRAFTAVSPAGVVASTAAPAASAVVVYNKRYTPERLCHSTRQEFEIELAQSGTVLRVPADRSVLDAVEQAGVSVLSSGQERTRGTCETVALDGEPDHRDPVLTAEEQQCGEAMTICVSRSRSPRLVLDL